METIINDPFIPAHHINGKVVDKPYLLWIIEEKSNFEIDFKKILSHVFRR